jgi:hypothetical protein
MKTGAWVSDSPRWCDKCEAYGLHHTDRHPATGEAAYVPSLLEYAQVIEWMEDHPTGDSLPEGLRAPFADALNRAALGRVAAAMSRACDTENE